MKALYERVLAQLPTPQLHESYNAVLKEEFASVSQTLGDVAAAFAKLQEVHDAVSKLQQRHQSTGGRSNSLRAPTDVAMELQKRLQRRVGKLAVGMEAAPVERKRKRVKEEVSGAINSVRSSGDEYGRASCNGAANETKRFKTGVDSDSDRSGEEIKRCPQKGSSEKRGDSFGAKRDVTGSASSSSSKSENGGEDDDDESDEDADEVEGSEAAWKALTTKGNLSAHRPTQRQHQVLQSALPSKLKQIRERRSPRKNRRRT